MQHLIDGILNFDRNEDNFTAVTLKELFTCNRKNVFLPVIRAVESKIGEGTRLLQKLTMATRDMKDEEVLKCCQSWQSGNKYSLISLLTAFKVVTEKTDVKYGFSVDKGDPIVAFLNAMPKEAQKIFIEDAVRKMAFPK